MSENEVERLANTLRTGPLNPNTGELFRSGSVKTGVYSCNVYFGYENRVSILTPVIICIHGKS